VTEREYFGIAKVAVFTVILVVATYLLFRVVIGALWGSGSNVGMIGAAIAGLGGVFGLFWLARFFFKNAMTHFRPGDDA